MPKGRGAISAEGYEHADYGYKVGALPSGELMPSGWKLDNFYVVETTGKLAPKSSPEYLIEYELDSNGDGQTDHTTKEYLYDVRFKNLSHDGVIFMRTIPLSTDMKDKKLSVLMDRVVESMSGSGYEVVKLVSGGRYVMEAKRFATVVRSRGPAKLGGREAHLATVEVANVDQVKVDPKARGDLVELVVLHTPFVYEYAPFSLDLENEYRPLAPEEQRSSGNGSRKEFPVIMLLGYVNSPSEFAAGLGDFHNLLNRIEMSGVSGFSQPATAASQR